MERGMGGGKESRGECFQVGGRRTYEFIPATAVQGDGSQEYGWRGQRVYINPPLRHLFPSTVKTWTRIPKPYTDANPPGVDVE